MSRPGFWDDRESALEIVEEHNGVRFWIEPVEKLDGMLADLQTALELLESELDEKLISEASDTASETERSLDELEFRQMLSGPHDRDGAILTIKPGAGGIDSQDWAEMLLRMYLYWAEKQGFQADVLSLQKGGEEGGIREAIVSFSGDYAYGYLRAETGIHRLVRLSPFDQNHRRHTSFVSVFASPDIDDSIDIEIRDEDLRVDTFRASGAGGQHVNKTSSAVRLTHEPTGIVVTCQNERSQFRNRDMAMKILRSRLFELEEMKRRERRAEMEKDRKDATWGNQIRSYVLHPYQMVKDHRTGVETSDIDGVLAGDIQGFMEAYLRGEEARE